MLATTVATMIVMIRNVRMGGSSSGAVMGWRPGAAATLSRTQPVWCAAPGAYRVTVPASGESAALVDHPLPLDVDEDIFDGCVDLFAHGPLLFVELRDPGLLSLCGGNHVWPLCRAVERDPRPGSLPAIL